MLVNKKINKLKTAIKIPSDEDEKFVENKEDDYDDEGVVFMQKDGNGISPLEFNYGSCKKITRR